jgi:hypothetical protein
VVLDGAAEALRDNEDVKEFYLGGAGDQRRSFKNLKSFRRRKMWLEGRRPMRHSTGWNGGAPTSATSRW